MKKKILAEIDQMINKIKTQKSESGKMGFTQWHEEFDNRISDLRSIRKFITKLI